LAAEKKSSKEDTWQRGGTKSSKAGGA